MIGALALDHVGISHVGSDQALIFDGQIHGVERMDSVRVCPSCPDMVRQENGVREAASSRQEVLVVQGDF